ncbi:magnesium/cobalt transporter CorA [soil metagenome]
MATDPDLDASEPATIGDCARYRDGERQPGRLSLAEAGDVVRSDTDGFVWIGLQQPTRAEVVEVAERFGLPELAVEDAVKAHQRPKVEVYGDVTFVVLKPVRYIDHDEIVEVDEIAMFVGETFVVTVRHGDTDVLRQVRKELDEGSDLLAHGPIAVLYRTADLVVDGFEEALDLINEDVDEIEIQVFGDDEQGHAERIYKLKREIAQFRRAVLPLATPLQRLVEENVPPIDEAVTPFFRDVYDHLLRAIEAIEGHDHLLSDVLQADLARLGVRQSEIAVRQNEDMRKISAWAAIGLLPTAVAGIYGMNFEHMPELEWEYGYFVVIGLIAAACLALYRQFRRRGWL